MFSVSWTNLEFYAFPPFICVERELQKIRFDKATGMSLKVCLGTPTVLRYIRSLPTSRDKRPIPTQKAMSYVNKEQLKRLKEQ